MLTWIMSALFYISVSMPAHVFKNICHGEQVQYLVTKEPFPSSHQTTMQFTNVEDAGDNYVYLLSSSYLTNIFCYKIMHSIEKAEMPAFRQFKYHEYYSMVPAKFDLCTAYTEVT